MELIEFLFSQSTSIENENQPFHMDEVRSEKKNCFNDVTFHMRLKDGRAAGDRPSE